MRPDPKTLAEALERRDQYRAMFDATDGHLDILTDAARWALDALEPTDETVERVRGVLEDWSLAVPVHLPNGAFAGEYSMLTELDTEVLVRAILAALSGLTQGGEKT